MTDLDPDHLDSFAKLLQRSARIRIDNDSLWKAFHASFPNRPPANERAWFADALTALADRGIIRLPSARGDRWDHALRPPVPTSVDLVREKPTPREETWRKHPWRRELAWVRELANVTSQEETVLLRIHEGLVEGAFTELAPLKYRSLQLTGHEKRLGELATQRLFAPGRLSLHLLGTEPDHPPLAIDSISDAGAHGRVLIVENAGTFQTARRILREGQENAPYDAIAFGDGTRILASVRELVQHRPAVIHYLGDLDVAGMTILQSVRTRCSQLGIVVPEPAPSLHDAMLRGASAFGAPDGWPAETRSDPGVIAQAAGVLPEQIRESVLRVFSRGNRIPEEVLGPNELREAWSMPGSTERPPS